MKKKNIISIGIIAIVLVVATTITFSFTLLKSSDNEVLSETTQKKHNSSGFLTILLEQEDGTYKESTTTSWPGSDYEFNSELSTCENGSKLTWNEELGAVTLSTGISDKCFIYFDKSNIKANLSNYTFAWEPVDGATTYQILSNGELLTSTTNLTTEIYQYYSKPGIYDIIIQALDSNNNVVKKSEIIPYTIEKLEVDISGLGINKLEIEKAGIAASNFSISNYFYNDSPPVKNFELSNIIENLNYNINYINFNDFVDYFSYADIIQSTLSDGMTSFSSRNSLDFSNNFCINTDICSSSSLSNFTAYFSNSDTTYYYDINSEKILVNCNQNGGSAFFIQLVEPGKIASDWYIMSFGAACVSSNTEVYVYDRKKKKFKKKKIKNIDYNDELLCWDFDNGCFVTAKPLWIMKEKTTDRYNLLKFSDGSTLETISQHRIFNVEKGRFTYPMTDDTPIGTTTFNANGEYVRLVSKEYVHKEIKYYNIITNYHINCFANNILTSCRLNNIYPIENMKFKKDNRKLNKREDYPNISDEWFYGVRIGEQPEDINRDNSSPYKTLKDYIENCKKMKK